MILFSLSDGVIDSISLERQRHEIGVAV